MNHRLAGVKCRATSVAKKILDIVIQVYFCQAIELGPLVKDDISATKKWKPSLLCYLCTLEVNIHSHTSSNDKPNQESMILEYQEYKSKKNQ